MMYYIIIVCVILLLLYIMEANKIELNYTKYTDGIENVYVIKADIFTVTLSRSLDYTVTIPTLLFLIKYQPVEE